MSRIDCQLVPKTSLSAPSKLLSNYANFKRARLMAKNFLSLINKRIAARHERLDMPKFDEIEPSQAYVFT